MLQSGEGNRKKRKKVFKVCKGVSKHGPRFRRSRAEENGEGIFQMVKKKQRRSIIELFESGVFERFRYDCHCVWN